MKVLFGAFMLLLAFGALPIADAQVGTRIYLPMVAREATPVPATVHIQYRAFSEDGGWSGWQDEGGIAGLGAHAMRAVEMRIISGPPGATIKYRAHIAGVGWQPQYILNGGTAGSENGNPIEAVQAGFENAPGSFLSVEPFVQDWGWLGFVPDFWMAGTSGQDRRMEAFRAFATPAFKEPAHIHVAYNANPRGLGYTGWKRDGEEAGTRGESRALNTFKAVLYNHPDDMILRYRCYIQDQGWQDFTDGECGNFSADKDIYAAEMRLEGPNIYPGTILSFGAHIANRGDVNCSTDNPGICDDPKPSRVTDTHQVGRENDRFRVEAIRIGIGNQQP
jgi:uncharacterized protein YjdB